MGSFLNSTIYKIGQGFHITIINLSFALVFSKAVLNEGASPHPLEASYHF